MKKNRLAIIICTIAIFIVSCAPPPAKENKVRIKHNYIILLDLSDRLIVQENQPERDVEIIKYIYGLFEEKVKNDLYIKSRDEIKIVIAPQHGSNIKTEIFEDELYTNIESIKNVFRKKTELERRNNFHAYLDTLYQKAVFSNDPKKYYGADIWKYFYEDLNYDISKDTLTENFLFILTDGYPIVGKDLNKLQPTKSKFSDLKVILIEAAPREKDMEWDRIMELWQSWFDEIGVSDYTMIKRKAISKEKEQLRDITLGNN